MRFLSVCSGIEAASVAWEPLGFKAVAFAEIDPFPCAVLKERFPDVPNLGDMTKINKENFNERFDLLVGGTPCQGFSVAGTRKGLDDDRSFLALEYIRLLSEYRPQWFVWENVPGAFTTNGGGDLKLFFREITEIGYGLSWRILDARFFRSAQRRRRLFAVGYFRDWRPSAAVLFERPRLPGDFKESGKIADPVTSGIEKDFGKAIRIQHGTLTQSDICPTLTAHISKGVDVCVYDWHRQTGEMRPQLKTCCTATANWGTGGNNMPLVKTYATESYSKISASETGATLKACGGMYGGGSENYVTAINLERNFKDGFSGLGGNKAYTLTTKHNHGVIDGFIRKLTPIECERLQNFPDNWTDIPYRGKEHAPHSLRYKALGNSMNVNVMRWIGERIKAVNGILEGK